MVDERTKNTTRNRLVVRILPMVGMLLLLFLAAAYLLVRIYIGTPSAAGKLSLILTGFLHQPAKVAGLELRGGTLFITGLTVENPVGFDSGRTISTRSIMIAPAWGELIFGRRGFDVVQIEGLSVAVSKNRSGAWNFAQLTKRLTGKKSPTETFIKRLELKDASFMVNGRGIEHLALQVRDLSTKGTTNSRLLLTCKDESGNAIRIEGSARLGAEPSMDLSLSAPSVSLSVFKDLKTPLDLAKGRGAILLSGRFQGGELVMGGKVECDQLAVRIRGGRIPLKGELDFAARYALKTDEAILDRCSLRIDDQLKMRARARVRRIRSERAFEAEISAEEMDVKRVSLILPSELRRDLVAEGRLIPRVFRLSGNAVEGVTAASGGISLRSGEVAKGEKTLAKDIAAEISIARIERGWDLQGRLSQGKGGDGIPLQALDTTFTVRFSNRMQLQRVDIPSITGRLMGVSMSGKGNYRPADANPLTAALDIPAFPLLSLNHYLADKNAGFSSGTGAISAQIAGRSLDQFMGKLNVRLLDLHGVAGGKSFALKEGATEASLIGMNKKLSVAGRIHMNNGQVSGKSLGASFSYTFADGIIAMKEGRVKINRMDIRFADIHGPVSGMVATAGGKRLPIRVEFSDVQLQGGGVDLSGLAGNLNAGLISKPGRRWLEGSGAATLKKLMFKGEEVGSLDGRVRFAEGGATAEINGKVLGGSVAALMSLDPFAPEPRTGFDVKFREVQSARLARFIAGGQKVKIAGGLLDASLSGSYSPTGGVRCRMEAAGREIRLAGKDGKTLLSDGNVNAIVQVADGSFQLSDGVVGIGNSLSLRLKGEMARAFSQEREGEISFSLPAIPLNSLLDSFVNLLPRPLQESTAAGTLAASGKVRVKGKKIAVDGVTEIGNALLEIPAQKLSVAGVSGTIPVSLDFSGTAAPRAKENLEFSRGNYAAFLNVFRQEGKDGRTFKIGKIRFGTIEFGETILVMRASNGFTEITSLKSGLSQGSLLGKGYFRYGNGLFYDGDILVNDLSLRAFCDSYPSIKGYISGRLDGILSLRGEGKGLNGLTGFMDLWTRSGKGEKMLVSKEFLQKLAGKKLKGIFFREDRPYDQGEISAYLENGYLTFELLDISHTNIFGIRDLSVSVVPVQNRIALDHLFTVIKEAASRSKKIQGGEAPQEAPPETEFKWQE